MVFGLLMAFLWWELHRGLPQPIIRLTLPLNLPALCSSLFIKQGHRFLSIIIYFYRYARLKSSRWSNQIDNLTVSVRLNTVQDNLAIRQPNNSTNSSNPMWLKGRWAFSLLIWTHFIVLPSCRAWSPCLRRSGFAQAGDQAVFGAFGERTLQFNDNSFSAFVLISP
jgi:hypothetical protein